MFRSDADRLHFLDLLRKACAKFEIQLEAYCLMGNHYHVVVYCPEGGISALIHYLASIYGRAFNRRHDLDGPLWRDRFTSRPIVGAFDTVNITRYAHRNPLELRYDIAEYVWSSYSCYLGKPLLDMPVECATVLELAGGRDVYKQLVESDRDNDKLRLAMGVKRMQVNGMNFDAMRLDVIDAVVASILDVDPEVIRAPALPSDESARRLARSTAIAVAHRSGYFSSGEIADHYAFSSTSSLSHAVRRANHKVVYGSVQHSLIQECQTQMPWTQSGRWAS